MFLKIFYSTFENIFCINLILKFKMKKKQVYSILLIFVVTLFLYSCGGAGNDGDESEKVVLSEKGKMLTANSWKKDVETLIFGDTEYQRKIVLENIVTGDVDTKRIIGVWEFNQDETKLIMKERIELTDNFKDPVTYIIIEFTNEKLVIQQEGQAEIIYTAI